jgi:hypothetical protein
VGNIAGTCPGSDDFTSLVNEATRLLMRRGHWFNTVQKMQFCTYNNCLTWPRIVGTPLAINVNSHMPVLNNWYSFMPMERQDYHSCCRGGPAITTENNSPVFNQIACNKGMYIRHYPELQADVGKSVTIYGTDINGQTVRSLRTDGTYRDGVQLFTLIPFSSTSVRFRTVTRVLLDEMVGTNRLYQYDPDNNVLLDMALYQAGETNPTYRTTHLRGCVGSVLGNGTGCTTQITALIKQQFIPVKYDSDLVQIDNMDALKLVVQAIKSGEAYTPEEREKYIMLGVKEMNLELNDKYPLNQIPVQINTFGSCPPARSGVGMI